ncbi:hypothetical protein KIPB_012965, partial [Kipferlia bialata]|eukprot:g12965.t1
MPQVEAKRALQRQSTSTRHCYQQKQPRPTKDPSHAKPRKLGSIKTSSHAGQLLADIPS